MSQDEKKELHELRLIKEAINHLDHIVTLVANEFVKPTIHILFNEGTVLDMDLNITLSPTASALGTAVETKPDGTPFTFDPTKIVWSVQDPSILSFTANPDGTAKFVPLVVGTSQVGVTDTATGASKAVLATVAAGAGANTMDITWSQITP